MPVGPESLRLPERLFRLLDSIETRQPHIGQVALAEPLDVVAKVSALPPLGDQRRQFAPERQATNPRSADAKRYHGSLPFLGQVRLFDIVEFGKCTCDGRHAGEISSHGRNRFRQRLRPLGS
jgi:hypothetical protein